MGQHEMDGATERDESWCAAPAPREDDREEPIGIVEANEPDDDEDDDDDVFDRHALTDEALHAAGDHGLDADDDEACPRCGLPTSQWSAGKDGKAGYAKNGVLFCCRGCGEATGCTCRMKKKVGQLTAVLQSAECQSPAIRSGSLWPFV